MPPKPYLHDVGPSISESLNHWTHTDLVFLCFLPRQQTGPLRRETTHLLIHVFLDLWRLCLPNFNAADMEGIDDSLYSRYIRSGSCSESQDPEVGVMCGDVGENGGISIRSRSFVSLICRSAAIVTSN
jgi:hypothetical protein